MPRRGTTSKPRPKRRPDARRASRNDRRRKLADWSKVVRCRDGACIVCGSADHLNAHHLLPKERWPAYQLEPDNGVTLCAGHHKYGAYSAHGNAIWFAEWMKTNRPDQYAVAVVRLGNDAGKERGNQ